MSNNESIHNRRRVALFAAAICTTHIVVFDAVGSRTMLNNDVSGPKRTIGQTPNGLPLANTAICASVPLPLILRSLLYCH